MTRSNTATVFQSCKQIMKKKLYNYLYIFVEDLLVFISYVHTTNNWLRLSGFVSIVY